MIDVIVGGSDGLSVPFHTAPSAVLRAGAVTVVIGRPDSDETTTLAFASTGSVLVAVTEQQGGAPRDGGRGARLREGDRGVAAFHRHRQHRGVAALLGFRVIWPNCAAPAVSVPSIRIARFSWAFGARVNVFGVTVIFSPSPRRLHREGLGGAVTLVAVR